MFNTYSAICVRSIASKDVLSEYEAQGKSAINCWVVSWLTHGAGIQATVKGSNSQPRALASAVVLPQVRVLVAEDMEEGPSDGLVQNSQQRKTVRREVRPWEVMRCQRRRVLGALGEVASQWRVLSTSFLRESVESEVMKVAAILNSRLLGW